MFSGSLPVEFALSESSTTANSGFPPLLLGIANSSSRSLSYGADAPG
jgi:hypothetical protein